MTTGERVQALVDYGFTERQAGFLVLVLRHSGLCVKRQYAACAGVANGGDKCNAFFDKLVRRGHAVATPWLAAIGAEPLGSTSVPADGTMPTHIPRIALSTEVSGAS